MTSECNCIPSIGSQIARANVGGTTTVLSGVLEHGTDASGIAEALAAVEAAEVVVLALGMSLDQEHEGYDVNITSLPGPARAPIATLQLAVGALEHSTPGYGSHILSCVP